MSIVNFEDNYFLFQSQEARFLFWLKSGECIFIKKAG